MRIVLAVVGLLVSLGAMAQGTDVLPAKLSGRWVLNAPSGTVIDSFSIEFEGNRAPGTVAGRLTWRGVNCGTKDEPIKAAWDGTTLAFEAVLRANVNTQRMNGRCLSDPTRFELKRKAGEQKFEGEGRIAQVVVSVTASP